MKKSKLAILSVLILAAVFVFNGKINKVTNPCVQDYVAGQGNIRGNVNVEDYYERDARFAIGAGEDGYAVFKDPGEAFAALREHYPEGISLIRNGYKTASKLYEMARIETTPQTVECLDDLLFHHIPYVSDYI